MDPAQSILASIDEAFRKEKEERPRSYIGASVVGNDCLAYLNLSLRGAPNEPADPQLKRIFRAGHSIEDDVVRDMKAAGLNVADRDVRTGRQHRRQYLGGHVMCNADGIIELPGDGDPHERTAILEIKSMNTAKFEDFRNKGVRSSHRHYYRQVVMNMAMFELPLGLLVAYNKNNSDYHAEVIKWDQEEWDWLHSRMGLVLNGYAPRIADKPEDWRCRGCFKRGACWGDRELDPACRLCENSRPNEQGGWTCKLTGQEASEVCDQYVQIKIQEKA